MRTAQLLLFCLLVCQTTESLTDRRVHLGQNVTLDCPLDVKDVYWVFQKLTDSAVLILRTFTSESTSSHVLDQRLKDKYSSLTLSRLFISNLTINELGIYYCVKQTGKSLQLSNGTRLYITESFQDQNKTEYYNHTKQQLGKTCDFYNIITITSLLLNTVLIITIIGLLLHKLKKPRKSRQQAQNVESELLEDLNAAQYSEIELPTFTRREHPIQINGTYTLLQMPTPYSRSTQAEIITPRNLQS